MESLGIYTGKDKAGCKVWFALRESKIDSKLIADIYGKLDTEVEVQGFITVDSEENITYINEVLSSKLGYEKLELLGESFSKLTSEQEFRRLKTFTQKRKNGNASTYNIVLISKSNSKKLFRVNAAPLFIAGEFMGTLGIFADITEENKSIFDLETSVQYHEMMVKYLPLGLIILDKQGNIINMNPAFSSITGLKSEQLLGKSVFHIDFLAEYQYRYVVDNLIKYNIDFDFDSDEISLEVGKVYLRLRGYYLPTKAQDSHYLLIFGDITKRKYAELEERKEKEQLQEQEFALRSSISIKEDELKEKEWQLLEQTRQETNRTLLAKISHFWRQPLNNTTVLIQSMQDDYEFGELNEASFNRKVNEAVQELIDLSNTLETLGYLSNDDVSKTEFSLAEVIERTIGLLKPSCQSYNINLDLHCDKRIYTTGFPRRFGQIIVNIMENAMEAHLNNNAQKPYIRIFLSYHNGNANIEIADNAGGIDADIASRIFDPYFTTSENSQGLGLYLAKKVIHEMYAGNIEYQRKLDCSVFVITMPAKLIVEI